MSLTPKLRMTLPPAGQTPWEDDINANFSQLDGVVGGIVALPPNFQGVWTISTAYVIGESVAEPLTGVYYTCAANHTSGTGTFSLDNGANPTYWDVAGSANANGESLYFSSEAVVTGATVDFLYLFGDLAYIYKVIFEVTAMTGTCTTAYIQVYAGATLFTTGSYSYGANWYDTSASTRNNSGTTIGTSIEIMPPTISAHQFSAYELQIYNPKTAFPAPSPVFLCNWRGAVIETTNKLYIIDGSGGLRGGAAYDGLRFGFTGVTDFTYRMRVVRTPAWVF